MDKIDKLQNKIIELDSELEKLNIRKEEIQIEKELILDNIKHCNKKKNEIYRKIRKIKEKVIIDFIKNKNLGYYYTINDKDFVFDKPSHITSCFSDSEIKDEVIKEETQWIPVICDGKQVNGGNAVFFAYGYETKPYLDDIHIGIRFVRQMYDENFFLVKERSQSHVFTLNDKIELQGCKNYGIITFWLNIDNYEEMFDKIMSLLKPISEEEYNNIKKKMDIMSKIDKNLDKNILKGIVSAIK